MVPPRSKTVRLIRIDDGHFVVPGSTYEIVDTNAAVNPWRIFEGNTPLSFVFPDYAEARRGVLKLAGYVDA